VNYSYLKYQPFNIHVDDVINATALHFLDLLDAFGFMQHINVATHNCGHTLDLVITQPACCPTLIKVDSQSYLTMTLSPAVSPSLVRCLSHDAVKRLDACMPLTMELSLLLCSNLLSAATLIH
jgi:hypothetical protein